MNRVRPETRAQDVNRAKTWTKVERPHLIPVLRFRHGQHSGCKDPSRSDRGTPRSRSRRRDAAGDRRERIASLCVDRNHARSWPRYAAGGRREAAPPWLPQPRLRFRSICWAASWRARLSTCPPARTPKEPERKFCYECGLAATQPRRRRRPTVVRRPSCSPTSCASRRYSESRDSEGVGELLPLSFDAAAPDQVEASDLEASRVDVLTDDAAVHARRPGRTMVTRNLVCTAVRGVRSPAREPNGASKMRSESAARPPSGPASVGGEQASQAAKNRRSS